MAGEPNGGQPAGDAIRRAVLRQTLLHPATVLPSGLAAVVALGSVVAGPPAIFLGASMLLASLGVGSFAVNYFMRPETFANRYVRRMEARRESARAAEVMGLRKELVALGTAEGVKAWDELAGAHDQFRRAVTKREAEGVALDTSSLKELASQTLEEGLGHLRAYVGTMRALKVIDAGKLQGEGEIIRQRVAKLQGRDDPESRRTADALRSQLASIDARLAKHRQGRAHVEEILAACEKCEGILEQGALDISTMREVTARFVQDAAEKLAQNLEVARRFNEALNKDDDAADRIYDRVPSATEAEIPDRNRSRGRETE